MQGPSTGRARVKVLALLLVAAALLVFAECVQRASDWRKESHRADRKDPYSLRGVTPSGPLIRGDAKRGQLVLELTPHLLFVNRPGQQLQGVTINAQGFRGPDWQLAKPPGVRRIVALGGSTAFGKAATSDAQVWSAVLERTLAAHAPTEVLNAGVIGFDSAQEMILLASQLLDYQPDLVLFFDGWNDFFNGGQIPDGHGVEHPHFREVDAAIARGQQVFHNLLRFSAFYRGIERKLPGWRLALGIDAPEERGYGRFRHREDAVARYGKNLERMIRLARAYGAASLVAPQPEIFQRSAPTPFEQHKRDQLEEDGYARYARARYRDYLAIARQVADAEGVPFVDTSAIFEDIAEDVFTDLCHLTDRGQARVAEVFAPAAERALANGGAPDR